MPIGEAGLCAAVAQGVPGGSIPGRQLRGKAAAETTLSEASTPELN